MSPHMCDALHMSEQPEPGDIPEWDTADRMRKSLRSAGMSPGDIARYLQVGGNTVSTWLNGRIRPSAQTLRLWALRTGVPFAWLCHGDLGACDVRPRAGIGAGQGGMRRRQINTRYSQAWTAA